MVEKTSPYLAISAQRGSAINCCPCNIKSRTISQANSLFDGLITLKAERTLILKGIWITKKAPNSYSQP